MAMNLGGLETYFWGGDDDGKAFYSSIIADCGILSSEGIQRTAVSAIGKKNFGQSRR